MQKFFVVLAALVGLGVYVLLESPLGQWGAVAAAIVAGVTAAWLVTLIPAEVQNDARIVAIGLSVLGWLYLIAIILKKGGEQADKVGAWAVIAESILLTFPVWALIWGVRQMAKNRKALPHTVPVLAGVNHQSQAQTGLGFADEMRISAMGGVLLGYAGRMVNPQAAEAERQKDFAAAVAKAKKFLGKRPQLSGPLIAEIRADNESADQVRQLAEHVVRTATAA